MLKVAGARPLAAGGRPQQKPPQPSEKPPQQSEKSWHSEKSQQSEKSWHSEKPQQSEKSLHSEKPQQSGSKSQAESEAQVEEEQGGDDSYSGKVKSFNATSGYGFIECEATFEQFGHDVYLPKGVVTELEPGQEICFELGLNDDGMPVVTAVWNPGDMRDAPAGEIEDAEFAEGEEGGAEDAEGDDEIEEVLEGDAEGETYVGEVARYDMALGRGFIVCDGTSAAFGTDVYVHRSVLAKNRASVGDIVRFKIHVNARGEPQASSPLEVIGSNGPKFENLGTVKSFSEKSGYGFVDCAPLKEQYGRDVYLPGSKAKGTYVGQEVCFKFDLNNDNMPVVSEIYPARIEFNDKGEKGGKGTKQIGKGLKDNGGKGDKWSKTGKGERESKGRACQDGKVGGFLASKGAPGKAMVGCKGGFGGWGDDFGGGWCMPHAPGCMPMKGCKGGGFCMPDGWGDDWGGGCGWVLVDPWGGGGEKGWGKGMIGQGGMLGPGGKMGFGGGALGPGGKGKAHDLRGSGSGGAGGGSSGLKRKSDSAPEGRPKRIAADKETFVGEVKRYDMCGRGFIESKDAEATFGRDVYVHQNVLATSNANLGDMVRFAIHMNAKGEPQAEAPLEVIERTGPKLPYKGTVKSYNEKNNYGFISCPQLFDEYRRDVYLPSTKSRGIYVGQEVYFDIDLNNDGMPVVTELYPVRIEMESRDNQATSGGKGFKGKKK